ncbi:MAG: hypothetical protein AAF517_21445 [Planctomycetota bacterium]
MFLRIALIASSLAVISGCTSFQKAPYNKGVGSQKSLTFIVPFQESKKHLWYGESRRGIDLANRVKHWARENGDNVVILEGSQLTDAMRWVTEVTQEEISPSDWQTNMRGFGVKYVVVGDLGKTRLRSRNVHGVYDAQVAANFRVINAESGHIAYDGRLVGKYDEKLGWQVMAAPSGEKDREVAARVMQDLATEIGKVLYGYWPE